MDINDTHKGVSAEIQAANYTSKFSEISKSYHANAMLRFRTLDPPSRVSS